MSNFADGLFQFQGVPVPIVFSGTSYFVKPSTGSDGNSGRTIDEPFKTLARALVFARANNNDVVYFIAESNTAANTTDYQSVVLDWNKDGVHLIGINSSSFIGQRSRISNLVTANAITDGLFLVSANGCYISGIGVFQGQAATNPTGASIAVSVTGERNHFYNCQFSGIGHAELDDATSRSLKVSGGENYFDRCYIGLNTIIRATATAEVEVSAGARNIFKDCMIDSYTSLSTFKALLCGTPDRFVLLNNCILNAVQGIAAAVSPTGAINSGSVNGSVLMSGGGVFGYTNVATADDPKTLVSAPAGGLVDMGLASAVDIA